MESVGRRAEVCSPSLYERIHECIETKNDGGGGGEGVSPPEGDSDLLSRM